MEKFRAGPREIWLRDFWPGKDVTKNFLVALFSEIALSQEYVVITSVFIKRRIFRDKIFPFLRFRFFRSRNVQLQFRNVYNLDKPIKKTNVRNIWYTGENRRPPHGKHWAATLSFETDATLRNNIYLPLWVTRMGETITEAQKNLDKLLKPRPLYLEKKVAVCAIVSNPEPTRLRFIEEVEKFFECDLYGLVFSKPVEAKSVILDRSLFNICFENDLYPGYVTEKVFDSWQHEAIPVWWGLDSAEYLNPEAYINVASLGIAGAISKMKYLSENVKEANLMRSQPILKKPYSLDQVIKRLQILMN